MIKKLQELFFDRNQELRERLFRIIILIGGNAAFIGILINFILTGNKGFLIPFTAMFMVMIVSLYTILKNGESDFAIDMVGLTITVIVFPGMFLLCGGIGSGGAIWFIQGLFYIFMMFRGKKFVFFFLTALVSDAASYTLAYLHYRQSTPQESYLSFYLESFCSVIIVGIAIGAILRLQIGVYEREKQITYEQKEELWKISNSKNTFFANISHEIRTPINTIIGLNEMILRENRKGQTKEYAENIKIASEMLLNLVNDVLDLSRIEYSKMEIIPVEYRLHSLFEVLTDMIRVRAKEKNLEFQVDIDPNLPSVLFGDEKRIKQVLLNILTNAVKYTKEGSVTLSAYGEMTADNEISLSISVNDTGIGIRKEDMEYLYDSFRRVDERQNLKIEGSGLGLSISKQLVELMGGEISVDSIYTKGSVFTVKLGQKVIDATPIGNIDFTGSRAEKDYVYQQSFEAPEARILIVDDSDMNLFVAKELLRATKVEIDTASNGEECLQKTSQKYYHVILMDYMMPEMNGAETLKALRKQENGLCRDSAVIVLTANAMSDAKELYQKYGFDGYLEKPIQGEMLEREVMKFIPDDILEYRMEQDKGGNVLQQRQSMRLARRKKVIVTSDSVCDLSEELLEKYDIKLIYLYIQTDSGRFVDNREIDIDNLQQYLVSTEKRASLLEMKVEEYEEFFAEALTQAENVIHISTAGNLSNYYSMALKAAKGFDHVHVIDSGQISCGQGLLVLHAAYLALEGNSAEEVYREITRKKNGVKANFLIPGSYIAYHPGYTSRIGANICKLLNIHPVLRVGTDGVVVSRLLCGSIEGAQRRYIRNHLKKKRKISTDVVYIAHVGYTYKELEIVKKEILACIPFEKVIIQKASFATACNAGPGAIGISYYVK